MASSIPVLGRDERLNEGRAMVGFDVAKNGLGALGRTEGAGEKGGEKEVQVYCRS